MSDIRQGNEGDGNPAAIRAGRKRTDTERLAAHLRAGGWTNEYLAVALGVTARTVERWRRGDSALPGHIWLAIDEIEFRQQPHGPAGAANFIERMDAGDWSVADLAAALNLAADTVRKWRRQENQPPLHAFLAIDAVERHRAEAAGGQD